MYPILAHRWFMSLRVWWVFAQLSYSMYLLHPVWVVIFYEIYAVNNPISLQWWLLYCVVNMIVSFAMSLALWLFVERPFMVLRD